MRTPDVNPTPADLGGVTSLLYELEHRYKYSFLVIGELWEVVGNKIQNKKGYELCKNCVLDEVSSLTEILPDGAILVYIKKLNAQNTNLP